MLLSALGRLFTKFLQLCGFTLGVEDILVTKKVSCTLLSLSGDCHMLFVSLSCDFRLTKSAGSPFVLVEIAALKRLSRLLILTTFQTKVSNK